MAGCTPSTRLLLCIIRLFIAWAEGAVASLRQRTETAALAELMRTYGTTDTALIMQRVTHVLLRLRALEAKVLHSAGLHTDPQLEPAAVAASSARSPSVSQPPGVTPQDLHRLPTARTLKRRTAAPVRATGPPHLRLSQSQPQWGQSILSHRGAWRAPSCRFPSASHLPDDPQADSVFVLLSSPRKAGTQALQTSPAPEFPLLASLWERLTE